MSLDNVANEDMLVEFTNSAGPPDIVYTGAQGIDDTKIVPTISTKCKAAGSGICTTSVTMIFAVGGAECPHTSATYDFVSGAAVILPGATKTKAENQLVLREGDASASGCIGGWTLKASPFTPLPCACACEISSAGQTKVKAQ